MSTAAKQDKLNNSDSIRHILQASNDALHQAIANKQIIIIATQNKEDKSKFTIVADSVYEKELEGVLLTFADPKDYLRLFPTEPGNTPPPIKCPPGTELDATTGKCIPIAPDSYTVLQIVSQPKSQTPQFHEKNVLDGKEDTKWAINQKGASLTLDLGSAVDVGTVWIWWGDGDKRSFYFNIGVSQTEDQDFVNIWSTDKMSSGKVNEFEPYNLSSEGKVVKCRFIHITVNGNSVNGDWAAISNIKVTKNVAVESAEQDIPATTPPPVEPPVEPPVIPPKPPVVTDPNTEPPKPVEGRLQFDKGGNQDATTWKAVKMRDNPELWKIVDDKGINIADQFTKKENCEITIKWYQWKQKQTPPIVEPPIVTPPPATGQVDKNGVALAYPTTGNILYTFDENFRDDGKRFDFDLKSGFTNAELTGYFCFSDGKGPDDEVSGKMGGGQHSDGSRPKVYDMGIKIKDGKARYRTEDKHPEYDEGTAKDKASGKGIPLANKFVGYRFVKKNATDGKSVKLQIWQDVGNNEGAKPANEWKLVSDWDVTSPLWLIPPKDHAETIRIDGDDGVKNLKWKWLSLSEIK